MKTTTSSLTFAAPILVMVAAVLSTVSLASAQQPTSDPVDSTVITIFAINGFVSNSYSYNFNRPSSRMNALRVYDFDDNTFKVDVAELVVQRPVEKASDIGYRIDLEAGASIPRVSAARGLFRSTDGVAGDFDLQQAFVSYIAPCGDGLRIDFGKFVTWAGYEVIDGYDGFNDNATRSFLFGFAMPSTHTGLRLGYAASSKFSVSAMAVNGWDNVADNNLSKTVGVNVATTPADGLSLGLTYIGGAERDSSESDLRHLVDLVASFKASDDLSFGLNGDFGTEAGAVVAGKSATWSGVALYAKLMLSDEFALALRGEYFEDKDGARTGAGQILKELTLTPEYRPSPGIVFRVDGRIDFSSIDAFDKDGKPTDSQATVLLNGLFTF